MINVISIVLTAVLGFISTVLASILLHSVKENKALKCKKDEELEKRETALETGVRQLLSVRLEEIYDKYAESNTIPKRAYSRWMKLHSAYKDLHGNGTFNHMKEEIESKHIIG